MKRSELAKKGLALVLTAAMCAQPLIVSAEEFSFQSEMEDAVVMEAEPEQVEESLWQAWMRARLGWILMSRRQR